MYFKLFIIINSLCSLLPIYSNILPSKCGLTPFYSNKLPDTRIKGGRKAKIGSWPWAVSIAVYGKPRCGGTIIHERFVLTAAHCVFQYGEIPYVFPINAFTIIVGSIDRFKEGNRKIPVVGVYPHEEYRHKRPTNDIALIKLACSVPLENKTTKIEGKIVPICLPPIYQKYNKNTVCFAIGWGFLDTTQRPAILREKKVNLFEHNACKRNLSTHFADKYTLCSISDSKKASGAKGDSGSSVVCRSYRDKWFIAGICVGGVGRMTLYTKISRYLGWIESLVYYMIEKYPNQLTEPVFHHTIIPLS